MIGPADLPIPLWKTIAGHVSEQGLQLKVVGKLDDPKIERKPFPAINDMMEQLQTEMYEGAATMTPSTATRAIAPAGEVESRSDRHDHGSLGGMLGSAAGAPLSQTAGSETERAQKESISQQRQLDAATHAEQTAGIGQTEQDQGKSERDADGRRLWEGPVERKEGRKKSAADAEAEARQSKDPTGQSGTRLDLTG